MAQIFSNNAASTLSAGLDAVDTTIFIQPGQGGRFPVIASPDFCYCTLENASGLIEVVKVTVHAANATALTVVRAQQGTTAALWAIGDLFELRPTAVEAQAWEDDIDDLESTRSRHAGQAYTGEHDFSAASEVSLPANTSIGDVSAAEIAFLNGVTSAIQPQFAGKADITGETYSGVHDFSGASQVDLPANTSIGGASASEIAALDGVTGNVQEQLNAKADVTGETYSGTHDFTGGAINVPTQPITDGSSKAASTAFVAAMAFATALPGQAGSAGKIVTTDGTNASWSSVKTVNGTSLLGSGDLLTGDVDGPASATDGNVALFDGVTGKLIKNSAIPGNALPTAAASQAEMEAGTETEIRGMTPLGVAQAIAALTPEPPIVDVTAAKAYFFSGF